MVQGPSYLLTQAPAATVVKAALADHKQYCSLAAVIRLSCFLAKLLQELTDQVLPLRNNLHRDAGHESVCARPGGPVCKQPREGVVLGYYMHLHSGHLPYCPMW